MRLKRPPRFKSLATSSLVARVISWTQHARYRTFFVYGRCQDMTDVVSVLVVADFEPFRQFVSSILTKRPEVYVIAEASNGKEAESQRVATRPYSPRCRAAKSECNRSGSANAQVRSRHQDHLRQQERSAEFAHEAISIGAVAYVKKSDAAARRRVSGQPSGRMLATLTLRLN